MDFQHLPRKPNKARILPLNAQLAAALTPSRSPVSHATLAFLGTGHGFSQSSATNHAMESNPSIEKVTHLGARLSDSGLSSFLFFSSVLQRRHLKRRANFLCCSSAHRRQEGRQGLPGVLCAGHQQPRKLHADRCQRRPRH